MPYAGVNLKEFMKHTLPKYPKRGCRNMLFKRASPARTIFIKFYSSNDAVLSLIPSSLKRAQKMARNKINILGLGFYEYVCARTRPYTFSFRHHLSTPSLRKRLDLYLKSIYKFRKLYNTYMKILGKRSYIGI